MYNKNALITKFIVILLYSILASLNLFANNTIQLKDSLNRNSITLELHNSNIKSLFKEISKQTKYNFIYSDDQMDNLPKISISAKNKDIKYVLNVIFKNTDYTYSVDNMSIAIIKRKKETSYSIKGYVFSPEGEAMPGVTIFVKGTNIGTYTKNDGSFEIKFKYKYPNKPTLIFSFIGMETTEALYEDNKDIIINMRKKHSEIDDVVITGYQTIERRDMVGAYTKINVADVLETAHTSIDNMLQGKVAGMIVTHNSSRVGTSPKIRIRGVSTLLGNREPLWVVDGIIQPEPLYIDPTRAMTEDLRNIVGSQISWLNPNDIATIYVLKDASATAIYGSKASNGVIVITTKKGSIGKMKVNYMSSFSLRTRPRYSNFNFMNSEERIDFSKDAFVAGARYIDMPIMQKNTYEGLLNMYINRVISKEEFRAGYERLTNINTDWFKAVTRDEISNNQNISISGGSDKFVYNASVGYYDSKGTEIGNTSKGLSGRLRLGVSINKSIYLDMQISANKGENRGFGPGVNPIGYATHTSRAIPLYEANGELAYIKRRSKYDLKTQQVELGYNILNEMQNSYSLSSQSNIMASLNLSWNINKHIKYNFTGALGYVNNNSEAYAGEKTHYITSRYRGFEFGSVDPGSDEYKKAMLPFGGELYHNSTAGSNYNIQNKFIFSKEILNKHRINALVGMEVRSSSTNNIANTVWGYVPERGQSLVRPTLPGDLKPEGQYDPYKTLGLFDGLYNGAWRRMTLEDNFISFFGNLAYSFKNKYVFNFNIRSDASNRFGQDKNKQFSPTFSFGASWRVAEEEYIKDNLSWLNSFNLKATYGVQGLAVTSISPEMIVKMGSVYPLYNQYYSSISSIPNPNLTWERTKTWNIGLDANILKGISINIDYYGRRSNALQSREIPMENGLHSMVINGGIIKNHGMEYTINFTPFRSKDFAWSININSSRNWNTIEETSIRKPYRSDFISGASRIALKEGFPISSFWSYKFKGLNPETGYPEFDIPDKETLGKDFTHDKYLVYSGEKEPYFTGGLYNVIRYKSFSISANFALLLGGKQRLPDIFFGRSIPKAEINLDRNLANRWRKPGDEKYTNIPALFSNGVYYAKLPDNASVSIYEMWHKSDIRVVNSSFLRCRQITATVNIPSERLEKYHIKSLIISATVNNVFVIGDKRFNGFDPELGNSVHPQIYSLSFVLGF